MNIDSSKYNLSDSYINGGAWQVPAFIDEFAQTYIAGHYLIALAVIIILIIVVIWLAIWKGKEGFNPTQNMRDQDSDQFGLGKKEKMDNGRGGSAFAQQVQSGGGGSFTIDPNAKAHQPGSLAWQVLNNSDFNCANRTSVADDAWGWMSGVSKENLSANKPKNDNDFSKVLAGQ